MIEAGEATVEKVISAETARTAARFRTIYTAAIYDILEGMGHPNQCLDLEIKPIDARMRIAGPAFTIAGAPDPVSDEEYSDQGHKGLLEFEYFSPMEPGCVVAISAGGEDKAGHWGELMSTAANARGAVGAVMDGGCRDGRLVLDIEGFSLFCRYLSPIEGRMRYRVRSYQEPIAMRGALTNQVRVDPGDWIVGDMDGVIAIPKALVEPVLTEAETLMGKETGARDEVRAGVPIKEVLDKYGAF